MENQENILEEKILAFTSLKDLPVYNDNEEMVDVECRKNCMRPKISDLDWISDIAATLHPNDPCVAFYKGMPIATGCANGMRRRFVVFNATRTSADYAPKIIVPNTRKGAPTEFWFEQAYQVAQGLWI